MPRVRSDGPAEERMPPSPLQGTRVGMVAISMHQEGPFGLPQPGHHSGRTVHLAGRVHIFARDFLKGVAGTEGGWRYSRIKAAYKSAFRVVRILLNL